MSLGGVVCDYGDTSAEIKSTINIDVKINY